MRFRNRQLRISIGQDEECYGLEEGEPLEVIVRGRRQMLCREKDLVVHPTDVGQPADGQGGQSPAPAGPPTVAATGCAGSSRRSPGSTQNSLALPKPPNPE